MHLQRLEMRGFKSFHEKVQLDFDRGITVVVGPNGSGKSNIADAIRWVLGEQRAKSLRGSKMEDVIFAGSDTRKPLGMAEVSLTLDNSSGLFPLDFNEVTVTRRVFRSGESEYLINKAPCRLKDVQELFMDTGVGKESFAIIGQGKVEEILNARPEERRSLFEEAAGITKYRNRKREAIKKLEETENSLRRVSDIIAELANQLEPLSQQAQKAATYQKLRERLASLEISLTALELADLAQEVEQITNLLTNDQKEVVRQETVCMGLEATIQKIKHEYSHVEEELKIQQQQLVEVTSSIERIEGQRAVAYEKRSALEAEHNRLVKEIAELAKEQEQLDSQYAKQLEEQNQLKAGIVENEKALAERESKLVETDQLVLECENTVDAAKTSLLNCLSEIAKLKNQLKQLQSEEQQLEQRKVKQRQKLKSIQEEHQNNEREIKHLTGQLKQLKKQSIQLDQKIAGYVQKKETIKNLLSHISRQHEELQEKVKASQSRLKVLQEMHRELEGFNAGVKTVLKGKEIGIHQCQEVIGVVAGLIHVPREYEKAITVALGGAVQYLVTTSERGAQQAIEYLKDRKGGRATFLPLEVVKPRQLPLGARKLGGDGILGSAAGLVGVEQQFLPVVQHLLGNILVVEDLTTAISVAGRFNHSLKIVTLEGEVLNPGGSMTGGSLRKENNSIFSRSRQIAEIENQVAFLSKQFRNATAKKQERDAELQEVNDQLQEAQTKKTELQLTVFGLEKQLEGLKKEQKRLAEEVKILISENFQLEEQAKLIKTQAEKIKKRVNECSTEQQQLEELICGRQKELQELRSEREKRLETITQIKVKLASLRQKELDVAERLTQYYSNRQHMEKRQQGNQNALKTNVASRHELEQTLQDYQQSLVSLVEKKDIIGEQLYLLQQQKSGLLAKLETLERELKLNRQRLEKYRDELHRKELQKARIESQLLSGKNRLQEKYGLTLPQAMEAKQEIINREEARLEVKQLQDEMKSLGTVNLGAIEEYRRLKERHDFLVEQQRDMLEAKSSLQNLIAEMDNIMKERFAATFDLIKDKFQGTFSHLFGGGMAELRLTDVENLLETGVEIIARPPGKKLQHLMQMSGGERALTAIALLFAFLEARPSPFCILDEIEASLDEANVERFAKFLQGFAQKTQFIAISHRQGMIEIADNLYGVTMEEKGVSKVLSLKLKREAKAG